MPMIRLDDETYTKLMSFRNSEREKSHKKFSCSEVVWALLEFVDEIQNVNSAILKKQMSKSERKNRGGTKKK